MAGGTGGNGGTEVGGNGATVTSTGGAGIPGAGNGIVTSGIAYASGGGGGSAGGSGGGPGGSGGGGAGGAGGTATATGSSATGGTGGSGGVNGAVLAISGLTNSTNYVGGYGGQGSQGRVTGTGVAGGGGGGEGGYGLIVTAASGIVSFTNTASYIYGGYGALGGAGAGGGAAGNSGDGGVALDVAATGITLTNTGDLFGGYASDGTGKGGVGLLAGSGLTLIDSSSIQGGFGYSASNVQADAIAFTGGANTIALSASNLLSGGISVASGASLTFNQAAGQFTNSLTLSNIIEGGGSIIKNDNTVLDLTGANTYTGGTTIAAGTLALGQAASAGTGAVAFGSATTTLELDFAGTTANPDVLLAPVSGFVIGDRIDLTAIASTAAATYANGVLTVSDGTHSDRITIGQAPAGDTYVVSNDGNGHALVTLAIIPTPVITGTHATADAAEAAVLPFGASGTSPAVTVVDPNAGATDSATITLSGGGGTLSGTGLTQNADGSYALTASAGAVQAAGSSAAAITRELDALSFTPTNATPGATATTTFQVAVISSAGSSATDSRTQVIDTAEAAPVTPTPAPTPAPAPAPTPVPAAPDVVSINDQASFGKGDFTLTGTASSASGVRGVEISAVVDGVATDLGAATVNADGTFVFSDAIGAHTQGFITATETSNAGGTAAALASYSLQGGLDVPDTGRAPFVAEQDVYNADGSATTSVSLFRGDGSATNDASRRTTIMAAGQTFTSDQFDDFENGGTPGTTFVFNPNHGLDTISLFRVDGTDHDILSFSGADFGNSIANLLDDTYQTKGGASVIYDPTTGDTVKLVGITKQQLAQNQGDLTFHA